jgi:hypothetical protein
MLKNRIYAIVQDRAGNEEEMKRKREWGMEYVENGVIEG